MSILGSVKMPSEMIDLTGVSSREASLRRSFPIDTQMASQRSKKKSSNKITQRNDNVTHQVRISLRSLDDGMDREILLTPERPLFEFSRASGRVDQNMKPLPDNAWVTSPIVSRSHCRVYADLPGQAVWLKDLGSTHGTFLNARRIQDGCSHRVSHGDRIRLGVPVVNGAATYNPKSFEVKFQWENRYDRPIWRPTRFDRDTRPTMTSSIPTPADSPEQLVSKTFSVPNDSDSDDDSVIIAGEIKKAKEGNLANEIQKMGERIRASPRATPTRAKDVNAPKLITVVPSPKIHVQIPKKVAGMSQIPIVTFSDSEDEVPESLPIVKDSTLETAAEKSTPKSTEGRNILSSKVAADNCLTISKHYKVADRSSPDYSPAYDNHLQSTRIEASQRSSQPEEQCPEKGKMSAATEDLGNYEENMDILEDLYGIASEDDWLPEGDDESSLSGNPNRPYGDDDEEAEDELKEYPSFRPRRGSTSSASSIEEDSDYFQPGQNISIHIPDSLSSESDSQEENGDEEEGGDDDDEDDAVKAAINATENQESLQGSSYDLREQNEIAKKLDAAKQLDAAAVIAMLRTQPPPHLNEPVTPSRVRHPRHETLRNSADSLHRPSRFVFGGDFDTTTAYTPPSLKPHYTQGPFVSSRPMNPKEPTVNTDFPSHDMDSIFDLGLGGAFGDPHEPSAASQQNPPHVFSTAPEPPIDSMNKARSTRVSIADIINNEACRSTGQKRKADDMHQDTSEYPVRLSFYDMDDNNLLHTSGKVAENALDSAAQRQLIGEVRAASHDPMVNGSHDTIPDAQPRNDILFPTDTVNIIDCEEYLDSEDETALNLGIACATKGQVETSTDQALPEFADADELEKLQHELQMSGDPIGMDSLQQPSDKTEQDINSSDHEDEPPRKKPRISLSTSPSPAHQPCVRAGRTTRTPTRGRFTWRSFVTGAVTGAVAMLGAAAAIVATVPPEVREEAMREW